MRQVADPQRPKAVIQSTVFLPYDISRGLHPVGGCGRYLRDLGRLFDELGYRVVYLQKAKRDFVMEYDGWAEVRGVASPARAYGNLVFARRCYDLTHDAQVVCYGNLEDGYPFVRRNSFAVQHGIWWDKPMPFWKRRIQDARVRFAASRVAFVVCVDTNFANWYRTKWPSDKDVLRRLHYVPNYADTEVFKPGRAEGGRPLLLFPRRFEPKRGYEVFIEMCYRLRALGHDFDVAILGSGPYESEVRRLVSEKLGASVRVEYADFESIALYYRRAYLTFIPTLWSEGTSLSAVEAICSGCPVVCGDVGGLANVIIPGFTGEVCPPSVDAFVRCTSRLLSNPTLREQMSRNCLSLRDALGMHRWKERIKDLMAVYLGQPVRRSDYSAVESAR